MIALVHLESRCWQPGVESRAKDTCIARDVILILAVPKGESDKKSDSHDGKAQVDVPSAQPRRAHGRARGGQYEQHASLALHYPLLRYPSRFTSRLPDRPSAYRR